MLPVCPGWALEDGCVPVAMGLGFGALLAPTLFPTPVGIVLVLLPAALPAPLDGLGLAGLLAPFGEPAAAALLASWLDAG